ncbi:hypothetical protein Rhsp01_34240 [Rhizobium sp. NBRC 114257]|uniref:Uncharacterized protein n=1 Tax=Rhizobium dioscoreae TaxID=2653122 RepID=A0ABQ0Z3M1_9HYPH|nr:hypothetical protein RsS93_26060 [Rhizobium dioscoreae]GLU82248.1 hypothetical protein Rhsp01_34240 [Rhizobium sp. NBRC 114257]
MVCSERLDINSFGFREFTGSASRASWTLHREMYGRAGGLINLRYQMPSKENDVDRDRPKTSGRELANVGSTNAGCVLPATDRDTERPRIIIKQGRPREALKKRGPSGG